MKVVQEELRLQNEQLRRDFQQLHLAKTADVSSPGVRLEASRWSSQGMASAATPGRASVIEDADEVEEGVAAGFGVVNSTGKPPKLASFDSNGKTYPYRKF